MKKTLSDRFWSHVEKTDGCWLWTASCSSNNGYGQLKGEGRKNVQAHRVSWEITNGPIPDGLKVLHKCDNPRCVRPDHLFLGTQSDNMKDCFMKGRSVLPQDSGRNRWNATKTHCRNGHEFTADNTYEYKGERQCKTCRRAARLRSIQKAA